uniref:C-type lectin domain-containing protein n=1 Tax=Athene cunicularia TaxID=194338 RepID=A0A663N566_ATHCN
GCWKNKTSTQAITGQLLPPLWQLNVQQASGPCHFCTSLAPERCWENHLVGMSPARRPMIPLIFPPLLSPVFPCGPGSREWEYFDGKCYYFSLTRMSWYKAKAQCEEMHSQLAVINSYAKQNFVMFRTRNERFWIGLTDENSEGEWEWIDGTDYRTTFTFWKEGEPNNSGSNEDCAHVWISGKWNDVYCTYECYYVCEKPLPN